MTAKLDTVRPIRPAAAAAAAYTSAARVDPAGFNAPAAQARLDWLRQLASRQRPKARLDLFRACAMLSGDPRSEAGAFAEALMRSLPQAMGGNLRLYRPGSGDRSFDETWLLALIAAAARGDADSLGFLIRRRVRAEARRSVAFLVENLARRLDTV